ncbi:MAG: L,D-transpeptidase [Acidimicrobiales bacterium]|nr:L,D-transpeptidase [Acidimicrobiales bacterium]
MMPLSRLLRFLGPLGAWGLLAAIAVSLQPGGAEPQLSAATPVFEAAPTSEVLLPSTPPLGVSTSVLAASDPEVPISPWQVTVAIAKPEVATPELYDAPRGQRVLFSDPVTNPSYFGTDLAMLVIAEQAGWLQVQLPVRPNGTTAWVKRASFTTETHTFHAEVRLREHRLRVWNDQELIADTVAIVGATATPTPLGRFYVNDLIPTADPSGSYGPWILSLSAHSEVLETFADGRPVIAIHGTNRPDLLGTAASNGCVRIPNDVVASLAELVPLGTPVDIIA